MDARSLHRFGDFSFDPAAAELRRTGSVIPLRAKTLALLEYLVRRRGEVVSRAELMAALWPGTAVTDVVLNVCISELRGALGEDARAPRYIQTVHRRGFRFAAENDPDDAVARPIDDARWFVGRDAIMADLHLRWARALVGAPQLLLIAADSGVGKTTLVDEFARQIAADPRTASDGALIVRGQCLELGTGGEPFMPLVEALTALCRGSSGEIVVSTLRRFAPGWLLLLPLPLEPSDRMTLNALAGQRGREAMLREVTRAIAEISQRFPLLIVLEDLHWTDPSTVDWLMALGHLAEGRLFIIGTVRPADAILRGHPSRLLRAAGVQGGGRWLALELLSEAAVHEYLRRRFGTRELADRLTAPLVKLTDGNPLFLITVLEQWLADGRLSNTADGWVMPGDPSEATARMPENLTRLLRDQVASFAPEERAALDAAAVTGLSFDAQHIAAGLECSVEAAEVVCRDLVERRRMLETREPAAWPDGTVGQGYRFRHAVHRRAILEQIPAARRRAMHQRIGERLEAGHSQRSEELAIDLAEHFTVAGDHERAYRYHQILGRRAVARSSYREAIANFEAACAALGQLAESPDRNRREMGLLTRLCPLLLATEGFGDRHAEDRLARLWRLARRSSGGLGLFVTLSTAQLHWRMRGEVVLATQTARELLRLAEDEDLGQEPLRITARNLVGMDCFHRGELAAAAEHLGVAVELAEGRDDAERNIFVAAPVAAARAHLAVIDALQGRAARARAAAESALGPLLQSSFPAISIAARVIFSWVFLLLDDAARVEALLDEAVLGGDVSLPMMTTVGQVMRGWARARLGRVVQGMADAEAGCRGFVESQGEATSFDVRMMTAEACLLAREFDGAASHIAEAKRILIAYHQRYVAPEIFRIEGDLALARDGSRGWLTAKAAWREGLEWACRDGQTLLRLRLALRLIRLAEAGEPDPSALDALRQAIAAVPADAGLPERAIACDLLERAAASRHQGES